MAVAPGVLLVVLASHQARVWMDCPAPFLSWQLPLLLTKPTVRLPSSTSSPRSARKKWVTREQLEQRLYRWGREVDSNAVEVHVHHLRRKLGPSLIQTVRGVGYLLPREAAE